MVKGLQGCEERLKTLGLSTLEAEASSLPYNLLRRGSAEAGGGLFALVTNNGICRNGTKLRQRRFRLGIRKISYHEGGQTL